MSTGGRLKPVRNGKIDGEEDETDRQRRQPRNSMPKRSNMMLRSQTEPVGSLEFGSTLRELNASHVTIEVPTHISPPNHVNGQMRLRPNSPNSHGLGTAPQLNASNMAEEYNRIFNPPPTNVDPKNAVWTPSAASVVGTGPGKCCKFCTGFVPFAVFFVILVPLLVFILAFLLGVLLAYVEHNFGDASFYWKAVNGTETVYEAVLVNETWSGEVSVKKSIEWSIWDGFLYVTARLTHINFIFTDVSPETIVGQVIDLILSFIALAVFGFIVGVFGSLSAVSDGTIACENASALICKEGKKWSRLNAFLFAFVLAPLIVAVPSASIALIISQLKSWSYLEGLKFAGSQILSLPYTLGNRSLDVSNPDEVFHSASLVLELFVATWSLAASGAIMGVLVNTSVVAKFSCFLERRELPMEHKEPKLPESDDDRMGYRGWHQAGGVERTSVQIRDSVPLSSVV